MTSVSSSPHPRLSTAAEALGYVGGVLVLVGVGLVMARTWDALGSVGRVGVIGGSGTLAALAAWRAPGAGEGFGTAERFKGTMWLVATLAFAVATAVGVHDIAGFTSTQAVVSSGGAVGCAVSSAVWWGRDRPLQQMTAWLSAAVCLGALGGHVSESGASGVAAVLVAAAALVVGLSGRSQPSTVAVWCGGLIVLVAGPMITGQWQSFGLLLSVAIGATLSGLAVLRRPVVHAGHVIACGVTGGIVLLSNLPGAIAYHAAQAATLTGAIVWVVAVALMSAAWRPQLWRTPVPVWVLAAVLFVVGPAVAADDHATLAPSAGVATAVVAVVLGVGSSSVALALVGSLGLLVFVPWTVTRVVPGAVAAPLAIVVAGLVIVAVALWLVRRRDLVSGRAR